MVGGIRFVGRAIVEELTGPGHEVLVVHRGEHEPPDLPDTPHLHVNRRELVTRRGELDRFGPDAVLDLAAATGADSEAVLDAVDAVRLLVVSSMDVYRAFASLWAGKATDAVPLGEDAPLRERPPPDREGAAPPGWDFDPQSYDKLDVERAYLAREATGMPAALRLRRARPQPPGGSSCAGCEPGRQRIPIGSGSWLGARGHGPELARGLRLGLESEAAGEVFNLCVDLCADAVVGRAGPWRRGR